MDGITYEPQEGEIEDESAIESEEKENEDELNTGIDMETVIDKKNDSVECSLIFSENESFSDVCHIVNDIINDREVKLEVQECINGLLDSVEKKFKTQKELTRKRSITSAKWKKAKRKKAHQAGQEYISSREKKVAAKSIKLKKDCANNCKFKCSEKVDKTVQEKIFMDFYKLDQDGKHNFINQTTTCTLAKSKKEKSSRKKKSYSYFLTVGEESFRVCKSYYLSTLAVSQKMIYHVHEKKDPITGVVKPDERGK